MTALEYLGLISLIFWLLLTIDRKRSWPADQLLSPILRAHSQGMSAGGVAIVPARNEADVLPETLPSLLNQKGGLLEVVLVDDGSEDDTAAVANRLATRVGAAVRLQILSTSSKPATWSGKVYAQHLAYSHLEHQALSTRRDLPDWLLLSDADIRHRPESLRALLQQASASSAGGPFDMVSVMARLRADNTWERLVVPAFVFFFQLLYPFRKVADPASSVAAAAGGCILIRRTRLEKVGGFDAIRSAIIDDVALAKAVKRSGGRIWLGLDPGIESVRPYPRLADLWQMISRTAFTQLKYRWDLLVLTLVALTLVLVSPPLVLGWGLSEWVARGSAAPVSLIRAALWAGLAWFLMAVAYLPAVRHHRVPALYSATLPVGAAIFGLMTISSAWNHFTGKGARWRGRRYEAS